jgi:ABC-type Fe3+ transport system substrate-binding protein
MQALAAGEGSLELITVDSAVQGIASKGGPVATVIPSATTGVEMQTFLTARAKAKHPNAARLLVHFVMTPEGNKIFADDPGSVSIYDTSVLPKEYQSPKPGALQNKGRILQLLGIP